MSWSGERQRHAMAARGVNSKYDKKFDTYMGTLSKMASMIGAFAGFGKSKYFKTDTGLPIHLNMMDNPKYFRDNKGIAWKIIWMTPEEYERAIYRGFDVEARLRGKQKAIPEGISVREFRIDKPNLERVKNIMKEKKIDMPHLRYYTYRDYFNKDQINQAFDQEGHHRIVAADELGETHIPVFIEFPYNKKEFDIVRPLITKRIKTEIEGEVDMSAGGVIQKPYRTRQQAELEYLEKKTKRREEGPSESLFGMPVGHAERQCKRELEELHRQYLSQRGLSRPARKTEKKLTLEDVL